MKPLFWPVLKSIVFIIVTVVATGLLLLTVSSNDGGGRTYSAVFADVTALQTGDDVRMAGVRVGSVQTISIADRRQARVTFTVDTRVALSSTVQATIRFRNLIGQRYIELDQGTGSPDKHWPADRTLGTDRTTPALDLTALFNGFQPLFRGLDPEQVNRLSYSIIEVFQGQGATITDLLTQTASLTSTLANKDQVIGEVIDNLNSVLKDVNARRTELSTTITTLQQLVSGLSTDRKTIGSALTGLDGLATSVTGLLKHARSPLQQSIESLGALAGNLNDSSPVVDRFLRKLPTKLNSIGRLASYGSWINTYVCSIAGDIPVPSGYYGGVGVKPVAARCSG